MFFRSLPHCHTGESYTSYRYSNLLVANSSGSLGCVSWRQTGNCSAGGGRQPALDKQCGALIKAGQSGFCECAGGVHRGGVGCHAPSSFSCADVCAVRHPARPPGGRAGQPATSVTTTGKVYVSFSVKNTGQMAGACEVAQLYIADDISSVVLPNKQLQGFERLEL
eukprot:SAG22_NODE_6624_length_830_cov_1.250342_2_plen_165_part_01